VYRNLYNYLFLSRNFVRLCQMEKTTEKITALVPCHNEAPRIKQVIKPLLDSPTIDQLIVVNDGSTDQTAAVLEKYRAAPKLVLINLRENRGKGGALKAGLKRARNKIIFLCDADLKGLTPKHVDLLAKNYRQNPAQVVIGLRQKNGFWGSSPGKLLRHNFLPLIAGERIIARETLRQILKNPISSQYGIEVFMNYYCRRHRIKIIKTELKRVNDLPKYKKSGYGWRLHFLEGLNIFQKYLHVYTLQFAKDLIKKVERKIPWPETKVPKARNRYQEQKVSLGAARINYATAGHGRDCLVLIHGWTNNWLSWLPLAKILKKKIPPLFAGPSWFWRFQSAPKLFHPHRRSLCQSFS